MLRLGIVDFDSSHAIEFTRRFNRAGVDRDQWVDGARVEMGCPGVSRMSPERIPAISEQIRSWGVEIVEAPEERIGRVDAVLVLSLCGSAHLPGVRPFLEAGIPAYVDKPFACSLGDAVEMIGTANEHETPLYHSSALPFSAEVLEFRERLDRVGPLHGAVSYGPAKRAAGNPGLFHYGIHAVAILFALMGPDCESVSCESAEGADVVTGRWSGGRIGVLRGNRDGATAYGFLAFCERGTIHRSVSTRYAYRNLCRSIVDGLSTGRPPVSHEHNLAEVRFVLAALKSGRNNAARVLPSSVH
ncbi:MAG: Gfo/Idh/MocA family protein [Planctomycetaceae bacterium]